MTENEISKLKALLRELKEEKRGVSEGTRPPKPEGTRPPKPEGTRPPKPEGSTRPPKPEGTLPPMTTMEAVTEAKRWDSMTENEISKLKALLRELKEEKRGMPEGTRPPKREGTRPPKPEGTLPPMTTMDVSVDEVLFSESPTEMALLRELNGEGTRPPRLEGTRPPMAEGSRPPMAEGSRPPRPEGTRPPRQRTTTEISYDVTEASSDNPLTKKELKALKALLQELNREY